jgi:serine/threonine protein phosphatase PrpC
MSSLVIDIAVASGSAAGDGNSTAGTNQWLAAPAATHHGALVAVAELLGAYDENEPAKELVNVFAEDFLSVPEYLSIKDTFTIAFENANRLARSDVHNRHPVTLSALVVQGGYWHTAHAGNNRVWLYRDSRLRQLTNDHAVPRVASAPVVTRACGLEPQLQAEYHSGTLETGDVLIVTTESTHARLEGTAFISLLLNDHSAAHIAEGVVRKAITQGARSGTAAVIYVNSVPDKPEPPEYAQVPPLRSLPEAGEIIDNFHIVKRRRKGRLAHYYSAVDIVGDLPVVLKFPEPEFMRDPRMRLLFLRDERLARRLGENFIAQSLPVERNRRSCLYAVHDAVDGENLAARLRRKGRLATKECVAIARQLATFLVDIHGKHIYHGDIRPENIILNKYTRSIQFLGLDAHRVSYWLQQDEQAGLRVLSPIYLAPEGWKTQKLDERSDIFAAGVTVYYLLTGKLPYGHVKNSTDLRERKYRPVSKYLDTAPAALSEALARACARDPEQRFATAADFLDAISAEETV